MSSELLISALTKIPVEAFDNFDEVSFEERHDDNEVSFEERNNDNEDVDSLGSCCHSPNDDSENSLSPSYDNSSCARRPYFVFPPTSQSSPHPGDPIKSTPKLNHEKSKRKIECKVKRNERERRRVRRLADGFRKLREVVPGNYKKLSKLDTLKRALEYMSGLSELLQMQSTRMVHDSVFVHSSFIKQEPQQYTPEYNSYPTIMYQGSTIPYTPVSNSGGYSLFPEKPEVPPYPAAYPAVHPYYSTPQRVMHYTQHHLA